MTELNAHSISKRESEMASKSYQVMNASSVRQAKVVFVGDTQVGKTAIINRFMENTQPALPTVGANSISCQVALPDGTVHLQVWDTAGQEVYKCLLPIYARGAKVAVVVFDLTNPDTLSNISEWMTFIKEFVDPSNVIIVGNKSDLPTTVSNHAISSLKAEYNKRYFQTSALTGDGIEYLFLGIAELISARAVAELTVGPTEIPMFPDRAPKQPRSCC
jgi:small GTP-binding protein